MMVLSGRANQVYSFLFSHRNQYTDRQISEWTGLSEPDVDAACLELVSAFDGTRFSLAQEETKWGRAYKLTVHKRPDNKRGCVCPEGAAGHERIHQRATSQAR